MVMLYVPLTVAPAASCTVIPTLPYVPAVVGAPVKKTVNGDATPPRSPTPRPGGRFVAEAMPHGCVPPETVMVPVKPVWPTVHWFAVSEPVVRAGLMVRA